MRNSAIVPLLLALCLPACEFDNYAAPSAVLEGRIVYQGEPLPVRQRAIEMELWEEGYELRDDIPVNVHQDGTFAAKVFDGEYRLAHMPSVAPWVPDQDTMNVPVRGPTRIDVSVTPYFLIRGAVIQQAGSSLTATFDVEQLVAGRRIDQVARYVGNGFFVDRTENVARATLAGADIASLDDITLTVDLADALLERGYVYARVGVKTAGVSNLLYTPSLKIELE